MNCVLYARVSTGRQAKKDLSIPAQFDMMRDFARQRNWTVLREVQEPGVTAKTPNRPALQVLLAEIPKADPKIGVIVVWKFDRWMRSTLDHLLIKRDLQTLGVRVVSVCEPVEDTAQGKFFENLMASSNEFYSDNLAANVRMGMLKKVRNGGWPHRPPRGYLLQYDKDGRSHVQQHPSEAAIIVAAFEHYATGRCSLRDVADSLKDDGLVSKTGRRLALAYVRALLSNPFYAGRLRWNDLELPGNHPALISQGLFDRVGAILKGRFKNPGAKGSVRGFPLRGLAICASCRGHMTAGWQKKKFGYYRCARHTYNRDLCPATHYCRSQVAEEQVSKICRELRLSDGTAAEILRLAEVRIRHQGSQASHTIEALRSRRSALLERELTLTERYVAGDVAPEPYQATSRKVRAELAGVEQAIEQASVDTERLLQGARDIIRRASSIQQLGDDVGPVLRPTVLHAVFTNVVLGQEGLVGFTLRKPLDAILKAGGGTVGTRSEAESEALAAEVVTHVASELAAKPIAPRPAPSATIGVLSA